MISMKLSIIIYIIYLFIYCFGWDLSSIINLNEDDYKIIHVSIFYIRAYLCIQKIPSSGILNNSNNRTFPTLIETLWPENVLPYKPQIYPNILYYTINNNYNINCNGILQAKCTTVDKNKALLWILDDGSKYCSPKLIVFNLFKQNEEIHRYTFNNYQGNSFSSIQLLDSLLCLPTISSSSSSSSSLQKINNRNCLLITLKQKSYNILYTVKLIKINKQYSIKSSYLQIIKYTTNAYSQIYKLNGPQTNVILKEVIVKQNHMFMMDTVNRLWYSNIVLLKYPPSLNLCEVNISLNFIGNLLGNSTSLTIDTNGLLYYYLINDGAILRWNSQKFLIAENHDVLYLTSKVIIQIIFGAKGTVWIIYDTANSSNEHCFRILNNYFDLASSIHFY